MHHRRPRERLGEEDRRPGRPRAHLGDQPLPERQRLRVRVVDAEDPDAVPHPVQDDVAKRLPEPEPVLGLPVDVDDVLVLLGRVLGVLDRPVGPVLEPLRMLGQPRVVGRALDREVERDLEPELLRGRARAGRSRRACRARDGSRRGRPPPSRSPTGCRGRPAARAACCCAPCARSRRSGGSAASRRRRSRARRARGSTCSTPGEAARTSAGRARTRRRSARAARSTSTASTALRTVPCLSLFVEARPFSTVRLFMPRIARPRRARSTRSSSPASTLRLSSSRQVAARSLHASTRNSQRPTASTSNEPVKRSFQSSSSGAVRQRLSPGPLVEDLGAEDLVPVAEHGRLHVDAVADRALGRDAGRSRRTASRS